MRIFLSWSGQRSLGLAQALRTFLPKVLRVRARDCFVSTEIEKGSRWFETVMDEMQRADFGIICLTPERLDSDWLHFEAGALAAQLARGRRAPAPRDGPQAAPVYTILHGAPRLSLAGPLGAYQGTLTDRAEMLRLLDSIERRFPRTGRRLSPTELDAAWTAFEADTARLKLRVDELIPEFESLFRRKTFREPIQECTDQSWGDRYWGARETLERLQARRELVELACPQHQLDLFRGLIEQLDGYVMDLRSLLLRAPMFPLTRSGQVAIRPPSVRVACERRRKRIVGRVSEILEPELPSTSDAVRYQEAESYEERKLLVHRLEQSIVGLPRRLGQRGRGARVSRQELLQAAASSWELDRINGYLIREYARGTYPSDCDDALAAVRLERERAEGGASSLMPLHYALRALKTAIPRSERVPWPAVAGELDRIRRLIEKRKLDGGRQVRTLLDELGRLSPARRRPRARRPRPG